VFRLRPVSWGRLDTFAENLDDPRGVLKSIGAFFVSISQRAFEQQGNPAGSWPERRTPNVPGIISDLRRVDAPKSRRFDDRPVPFDTGLLERSVAPEPEGANRIAIGVTAPAKEYADVQHFGGESETEEITQEVVDRLTSWLDSPAGKPYVRDLGWLVEDHWVGQRLKVRVRARPWLDYRRQDFEDLGRLLPGYMYAAGGLA